jgi:hypothetical protein
MKFPRWMADEGAMTCRNGPENETRIPVPSLVHPVRLDRGISRQRDRVWNTSRTIGWSDNGNGADIPPDGCAGDHLALAAAPSAMSLREMQAKKISPGKAGRGHAAGDPVPVPRVRKSL